MQKLQKKKEKCKILQEFCLKELLDNIGIKNNIVFDQECYSHLVNYTEMIIDTKVSSGIRESIRILEKILLEINKEILCEILPKNITLTKIDDKVTSNCEIKVTYNTYINYFDKLKSQFLVMEIDEIPFNMYI